MIIITHQLEYNIIIIELNCTSAGPMLKCPDGGRCPEGSRQPREHSSNDSTLAFCLGAKHYASTLALCLGAKHYAALCFL